MQHSKFAVSCANSLRIHRFVNESIVRVNGLHDALALPPASDAPGLLAELALTSAAGTAQPDLPHNEGFSGAGARNILAGL